MRYMLLATYADPRDNFPVGNQITGFWYGYSGVHKLRFPNIKSSPPARIKFKIKYRYHRHNNKFMPTAIPGSSLGSTIKTAYTDIGDNNLEFFLGNGASFEDSVIGKVFTANWDEKVMTISFHGIEVLTHLVWDY